MIRPRQPKAFPKIIPPRSRVRLVRAYGRGASAQKEVGREFRVGYYTPQDGLDCIWLVNELGEYEQTVDGEFLRKYFEIERLSEERDYYGETKLRLGPLRQRSQR